jgi:hypothetical protein
MDLSAEHSQPTLGNHVPFLVEEPGRVIRPQLMRDQQRSQCPVCPVRQLEVAGVFGLRRVFGDGLHEVEDGLGPGIGSDDVDRCPW